MLRTQISWFTPCFFFKVFLCIKGVLCICELCINCEHIELRYCEFFSNFYKKEADGSFVYKHTFYLRVGQVVIIYKNKIRLQYVTVNRCTKTRSIQAPIYYLIKQILNFPTGSRLTFQFKSVQRFHASSKIQWSSH